MDQAWSEVYIWFKGPDVIERREQRARNPVAASMPFKNIDEPFSHELVILLDTD